jgi:hypothetical protein
VQTWGKCISAADKGITFFGPPWDNGTQKVTVKSSATCGPY